MTIYTARARQSDGWWAVSVDEIEGLTTRARRLEQVPAMVLGVLAEFPGVAGRPEDAIVVVIPEEVSDSVVELRELNEKVRRLRVEEQRAMRRAAHDLCAKGLTPRDVGEILGVSFKRVRELVRD